MVALPCIDNVAEAREHQYPFCDRSGQIMVPRNGSECYFGDRGDMFVVLFRHEMYGYSCVRGSLLLAHGLAPFRVVCVCLFQRPETKFSGFTTRSLHLILQEPISSMLNGGPRGLPRESNLPHGIGRPVRPRQLETLGRELRSSWRLPLRSSC
jgi:hypothetical protein